MARPCRREAVKNSLETKEAGEHPLDLLTSYKAKCQSKLVYTLRIFVLMISHLCLAICSSFELVERCCESCCYSLD